MGERKIFIVRAAGPAAFGMTPAQRLARQAERKGMSVGELERWLAPNVGYDPNEADAA